MTSVADISLPPGGAGAPARLIAGLSLIGAVELAAALASYALLDASLGMVFAACVIAALAGVAGAAMVAGRREILLLAGVTGIASSLPALLASAGAGHVLAALQLLCLCTAISGAGAALTSLLARGIGVSLGVTCTTILVLLWLTWPVWLSAAFHTIPGAWAINNLLFFQPMIALNGAYVHLGDWSHAPIAYRWLTNLGQDIAFTLPANAWWSVLSHALAMIAIFLFDNLVLAKTMRRGLQGK